MNDLEICKAIAKLEGVRVAGLGAVEVNRYCYMDECGVIGGEYNPITDLALNCMLRDKYEVNIVYDDHLVFITSNQLCVDHDTLFDSVKDVPSAICECILKSKGLWK